MLDCSAAFPTLTASNARQCRITMFECSVHLFVFQGNYFTVT